MLIRDLKFGPRSALNGMTNRFWEEHILTLAGNNSRPTRVLKIERPLPANTAHSSSLYWMFLVKPGHPTPRETFASHHEMDEFTAQCVLDHYLNNNSLDETHA